MSANGNGNGAAHATNGRRTPWGVRALDVAGALVGLTLSFPLLLVGAAAVAMESGRPVFFGHVRLGKAGKPFRCWKLRTMTPDAERRLDEDAALKEQHKGNGFKLPTDTDPRVTPVGRRLRLRYLDEIPQLLNVLDGSMSLVGPRPIVPQELEQYGRHGDELLSVKPGVFGAWTARGRERPAYPERAQVELEYVRRRSIVRDLAILVRSLPVVLRGQNGA